MLTSDLTNFVDNITNYSRTSYSQEREDLILARYFKNKKKGFYVDIGAHHPFRFSNTCMFYKKGWKGINIDATPGSMKLFRKFRPRDINLEMPISNNSKKINYYLFNESALNSFSSKLSKERDTNTKYKIDKIIKLKPNKLSKILDDFLLPNITIDFMSIDVEGYEYQVLVSNNWHKYNPKYLLVEILKTESEDVSKNKIYLFLKNKNYQEVDRTGRTIIFKRNL